MSWLIAAVIIVGVPAAWLLLVARRDRRGRASTVDPYGNRDLGAAGQPQHGQPTHGVSSGRNGLV
jgi:hypothetical protein